MRAVRGPSIIVAAFALLAGAVPGLARADCGGTKYARPAGRLNLRHRPPLAIGDSTMLLAVQPLAAIGFEVNARGCRPMVDGLELLEQRRRHHRLPKVVLIHLGANYSLETWMIRRALRILGPRRILAMVTPRPGHDAEVVRSAGKRWPRRVKVLDWVRFHAGHYSWFSGDGLHLSESGVRAFVRLCRPILRLNRLVVRTLERGGRRPGNARNVIS
jgi:hypothetical protein